MRESYLFYILHEHLFSTRIEWADGRPNFNACSRTRMINFRNILFRIINKLSTSFRLLIFFPSIHVSSLIFSVVLSSSLVAYPSFAPFIFLSLHFRPFSNLLSLVLSISCLCRFRPPPPSLSMSSFYTFLSFSRSLDSFPPSSPFALCPKWQCENFVAQNPARPTGWSFSTLSRMMASRSGCAWQESEREGPYVSC